MVETSLDTLFQLFLKIMLKLENKHTHSLVTFVQPYLLCPELLLSCHILCSQKFHNCDFTHLFFHLSHLFHEQGASNLARIVKDEQIIGPINMFFL